MRLKNRNIMIKQLCKAAELLLKKIYKLITCQNKNTRLKDRNIEELQYNAR